MNNFLSIDVYPADWLEELLRLSAELKQELKQGKPDTSLAGKTLVLLFEKKSLRTSVSFRVAMTSLGGTALYLKPDDIGIIGQREPAKDMARILSGYVHVIAARTFAHQTLIDLAEFSDVPIVNALSDWTHPCQAMADLLTIREHCETLAGLKLAYIGDGNNVVRSLAFACAKFGLKCAIASPAGYELDAGSIDIANGITPDTATQTNDPRQAVAGADIIYTDTWVSMGQEDEKAQRIKDFEGFQLNSELLKVAPPAAKVMHCLPAYRGYEITDEVVESAQSIIFDQAENRLHFQRALLKNLLT